MKSKAITEESDVTLEDQTYINEFSRLYTKNKIIHSEIKTLDEYLEEIKDSKDVIEESFGSKMKLAVGECFYETDEDSAKAFIEKLEKEYKRQHTEKNTLYTKNQKRMDELKIILYAKFGNRLRLEEEDK